ncbi:MAG: shikimate dehydrogenase [Desulfomonilia bacterium]|jgi:shikimate dehydrogenase
MRITGATRVFTILASPSRHVVAPLIFNRLFALLGLDMVYIAHDIPAGSLPGVLQSFRTWRNLGGFNVTIPHKESAAGLLDRLLPPASDLGAVNTVVRGPGGRLTGYNTDGLGAVRALGDVRGAKCLVIGAGGAARAVVHALLEAGALRVSVLNRSPDRTRSLLERFEQAVEVFCPDVLPDMDVVVQATPVTERVPFDLDLSALKRDTRILETVMQETALSREASSRGLHLAPGHLMLFHQTAENFRLLTGIDAPEEIVSRAFRDAGFVLP